MIHDAEPMPIPSVFAFVARYWMNAENTTRQWIVSFFDEDEEFIV